MKKSQKFLNTFLPGQSPSLKNKEYRKLFFCKFKIFVKGNNIFLMNLECVRPNSGYGSKFLSYLCKKADRLGMTLSLDAIPQFSQYADEPLSNESLISFYERFGFKKQNKIKIYGNHSAWRMTRK